MIRSFLFIIAFSAPAIVSGQFKTGEANFERIAEGYRFNVAFDTSGYFAGDIRATDSTGKIVFEASDFFTSCYSDTLIDLDGDGTNEILFGLATGMSPYQTGSLLIFDPSSADMTPFEIINGEVATSNEGKNYIRVCVRMSPAYLGALYYYLLEYRKCEFVLVDPMDEMFPSYMLDSGTDYYQQLISDYEKEGDICSEGSGYFTLFQAYAMQSRLTGRENFAGEFFRKNYRCSDSHTAFESLKRSVEEMYDYTKRLDYRFAGD